ncbi:MAG TPA: hypothetical protein VJV22_14085 [Acidobacteriaceae bacterium]|nr:hypothetical protein [Acidobacteriaceae bacterium]
MAKLEKTQQIEVNVAYFRQNLQRLLKEVEKGKTIRISRYQKTVAVVSPPDSQEDRRPKFGTGKGRVRIVDPHWADPMTDDEVDAFLEGRY